MIVSTRVTRGGRIARMAMAHAASSGHPGAAERYAASHFPDTPELAARLKSAVGATTDDDLGNAHDPEFLNMLAAQIVAGQFGTGKVPSLRLVPFNTSIVPQVDGGLAFWVGQAKAKPLTKPGYGAAQLLESLKVAVITVIPEETTRARGPSAETSITGALVASTAIAINDRFLNPSVAEDPGVAPAAITNGVTSIPSTGDVTADVIAAAQATVLDLTDAVLIMSPLNAIYVASALDAELGVKGGTLLGFPVLVSSAIGANLALVHASAILYADDGRTQIDRARHASIEMDDNPTQDSAAPTGSTMVSMFQSDSVAIRVERTLNWRRAHPSAVILVSDADYAGLGS